MKSSYRPVLEQTFQYALNYLENLDDAPVAATVELQELRRRLNRPLALEGADAAEVINDLVSDVAGGIIGSASGRFFAWVIGGSLPAALAADWLTSVWDQNAALYSCAPAAAVVEEVCGQWLKELLGLPADAGFALVTGGQMANTTCLAAARHHLLAKKGWDTESKGLCGAPPFRILCGGRHGSIERSVRLLGLGSDSVIDLPTNETGQLETKILADALSEDLDSPTIILLQAGDINTGSFDSFAKLVPLARRAGAWVHVDGAFGLWANASPQYKHLLDGCERADSWATDGHKWLNVPYDCGYAFVADAETLRCSMAHRAIYLTHDREARDQIDWTPEWSRRGRGVATYAAVRQLGKTGVADLIERTSRHASELVRRIGALPGAEIVSEAQINQGLVRFLAPMPDATTADHDRRTDEIIAKILDSGEAFFSGSNWRGKRCMRVSVCNWQTNGKDVERAVRAAQEALES